MARTATANLPPYAKPDSPAWQTEGLVVSDKTEEFKAAAKGSDDKVKLTATYRQVEFPDFKVASDFFGGIPKLLEELADSVNGWLQIQAKNAVKQAALGFENRVADGVKSAVAAFTSDRGAAPTANQLAIIKQRVRTRLEELARLEKEAQNFSDI